MLDTRFLPYLSTRSILLWTSIMELISLSGICRFLRTFSTFTFWFTVSGWLMSLTWTNRSWRYKKKWAPSHRPHSVTQIHTDHQIHTECLISSKVAEKESMSWCGSWERKPMVSTYRTVMRLGNRPAWMVTSRVAKSWFLGWRPLSPVSALIRVVFPGKENKRIGFNIKLKLWISHDIISQCCSSIVPALTTVCISQHGDNGKVLVFPLSSQKVPLFPQFFQRWGNLHLPLLQQSLLDLPQGLTCKDQPPSWIFLLTSESSNQHPGRRTLPFIAQGSGCYLNLRCTLILHPAGPSLKFHFSDEICPHQIKTF